MKKVKTPKIFKKQYTREALDKKILKRIHIPKDRKMISDLFVENSKGKMELKGDLPKATEVKLKALSRSIKKNKGFVKTWKAAVVLVLVAALLVFNLFFKDALIKRTVESGLEPVLNAQVTINNPHLSLLKGMVTYESLTIADADKPMVNLIETGRAQVEISIAELMGKRIRIEQMSIENVMWNTPRSENGSLPGAPPVEEESVESENAGFASSPALSPGEFDFQTLIDEQKNNLSSLKLINESNGQINELESRWSSQLEEKKKEIDNLSVKIEKVKSLDPKNIGSIEDARAMIGQINGLYGEVDSLKRSVSSAGNTFIDEKNKLAAFSGSVTTSIENDISYLEGFLDFSTGDLQSIASGLAETYIRNRWNDYYEYGLKALKIYRRFQDREKKKSDEKRGLNRDSGRNILFPSPDKPQFLINHILLSGGDQSTGNLHLEISTITSEPDKVKEPLTFEASLKRGNSSLNLDGSLDLRTDSDEFFSMDILSPENPVVLEEGFPALSISQISGKADFSGRSIAVRDRGIVRTSFDIVMEDLNIEQSETEGLLGDTLADLFARQKTAEFNGEVSISTGGIEDLSIETGMDKILTDSVGGFLSDLKGSLGGELRNNLLAYLEPDIKGNKSLLSSLDALGVQSLNQVNSVENLNKVLDDKKTEISNKADSLIGGLTDGALDKVKDTIKLPGF